MKALQISMFGKPKLHRLAEDQTPIYRVSIDPRQCNFIELIATLIGGDTQIEIAEAITERWPTALELQRASIHNLMEVHGLGQAKAVRIVAALELGRQVCSQKVVERPTVHSPRDAAAIVQAEMAALEREELWVLLLDTRNRLMGLDKIYKGSVNSTQVRVGEVFKDAVRRNATGIILVHNHPSTDASPSPDDAAITRAAVQAGKLLDVEVLDHLIIGGNNHFVSLKERNLGF
jgi:DNA repair protein RadC